MPKRNSRRNGSNCPKFTGHEPSCASVGPCEVELVSAVIAPPVETGNPLRAADGAEATSALLSALTEAALLRPNAIERIGAAAHLWRVSVLQYAPVRVPA